ncbi:MAG: hypothetical protein SGJ27_23630 [Candidatus Melainabacteria bacterium]|nr:hypothetical protein [Candidatus Melainabacteria bacterium]
MFAHLLIIAELCILAAAFYYVFVREPRPYEIKENIWGYYDHAVDASTGYGIAAAQESSMARVSAPKKSRRVSRRVIHTGHVLLRSAKHGVKRKMATASAIKQGWVESNERAKQQSPIAAALAFLGETLTKLSVKIS